MNPPRLMFSGRDFNIVFVRVGLPPNAAPLSAAQVDHELRSSGGGISVYQLRDIYKTFCDSLSPASFDEMVKKITLDVSQGRLVAYRLPKTPVASLSFADLWANYPFGQPYPDPNGLLDGNQCAVKMSVTLAAAGVSLGGFPGAAVILNEPQGPIRAAIRASELANWLKEARIAGLSKPEDITGTDWRTKIAGRQGIVYFGGFWPINDAQKADPKLYSGDHIDLWNGSRLEISRDDLPAQISRNLGIEQLFPQQSWGWHDLGKSKKILFWQVQ